MLLLRESLDCLSQASGVSQLLFKTVVFSRYTYGEKVQGAYHCQFGVLKKGTRHDEKETRDFIKGLELTGSVRTVYLSNYVEQLIL